VRLAQELPAVALPLPLQPFRQAQDDDVQKAAQRQPEGGGRRGAQRRVLLEEGQPVGQPTTAASLKIGRYMATTLPPTITPMNTMIRGSIRLLNASTALLTSCS